MWNERLAALVPDYPSGILTVVEPSGYPVSVRCGARMDRVRQVFTFPDVPPLAASWRGKACLLFHAYDARMEGLRQMVIKGELDVEQGVLTLYVSEFVTANGRRDTDRMPHARRPVHLAQFFLLGRRKASAYLRTRGQPWPPIPFAEIQRLLAEEGS
jgi:hypothetical protein